jgi:hypothetical protein
MAAIHWFIFRSPFSLRVSIDVLLTPKFISRNTKSNIQWIDRLRILTERAVLVVNSGVVVKYYKHRT